MPIILNDFFTSDPLGAPGRGPRHEVCRGELPPEGLLEVAASDGGARPDRENGQKRKIF